MGFPMETHQESCFGILLLHYIPLTNRSEIGVMFTNLANELGPHRAWNSVGFSAVQGFELSMDAESNSFVGVETKDSTVIYVIYVSITALSASCSVGLVLWRLCVLHPFVVRPICKVNRSYRRWLGPHNTYPPRRRPTTAFRCRSHAMGAVKLDHSDPAEHRAGIMQQLRQFWMDDHLCDVVLKSHDGAEHRAHTAVLSAASVFFKKLLGGPFLEAERVRQKQPVEMDASKVALSALLDYIYDGQPEVPVEVALELLRLAEAYNLPKLANEIEAGIRACLDSSVALQVLQEAHGLHSLRAACEDKVAEEFETCSQHPDFLKLSESQLARILKREDLTVSREEAVLNAIFAWNKVSKDRHAWLGMLLQHVRFHSLSIENLLRLGHATLPGRNGDDLHRDVAGALTCRKRTQNPGTFQSKRRRLQHWSPFLGASPAGIEASAQEVLPFPCPSLCWHQGELFATHIGGHRMVAWKPGEPSTCVRPVAGEGAAVAGINDLGSRCFLAISPSGELFVSDWENRRILRFQNGSGDLVVGNADVGALFCSPSGVLYVVSRGGRTVAKVVGSTLETVIASESLPADMQFDAWRVFVTKKEVIYLSDNLNKHRRILCINPAESLEPVVVAQIPAEGRAFLQDLFVTEGGTIYVADYYQRKVLAFHPSSPIFTEVLQCPDGLHPAALLLHDRSLYVAMVAPRVEGVPRRGSVYKYVLPPELQLHEWDKSPALGVFAEALVKCNYWPTPTPLIGIVQPKGPASLRTTWGYNEEWWGMIITCRPADKGRHRVWNTTQVVNGPPVSIFVLRGCIDANTGHVLQPTKVSIEATCCFPVSNYTTFVLQSFLHPKLRGDLTFAISWLLYAYIYIYLRLSLSLYIYIHTLHYI